MNLYNEIFRRKSFHRFTNTIPFSDSDLNLINDTITNVTPLDKNIKTKLLLVKENLTSCKLGSEYCILFYSEKKDFYLENIGYIGEQIDLILTKNNIGTLWCGLGKTKNTSYEGLNYVIMMCISKVDESLFRNDISSFKRKKLDKIWSGDLLPISNDILIAPSSCNSQPWFIENINNELLVYRNKESAKFGIIPLKVMHYYNQIDMGICLYFIEICLMHHNYTFNRLLIKNDNNSKQSKILITKYTYIKNL
jgi:hypothetical protein